MKKKKIIDQLYGYIEKTYKFNQPFLIKELYDVFPNVKQGTIRESMRRLFEQGKLIKSKNGVYGLPDPNRILKTAVMNSEDAVNKKYIISEDGSFIGYRSGFYIANALRLTTQTSSDLVIYSNEVSKKKRAIRVKNMRVTINQARVKVTNDNYKLLQVLDLFVDYKKFSEYSLDESKRIISDYLNGLNLSKVEIENIVDAYPKDAQIQFYKLGGAHAFTHK
jgi:predicted transcriptional regulator of viral defense system